MLAQDLNQFYGSETFWTHPLYPRGSYTDGVRHVAKEADAYWLIEAIFSYIPQMDKGGDRFYPIRLERKEGDSFVLSVGDRDGVLYVEQEIKYSDFPFDTIRFFCCDNGPLGWTLMLPSEY